MGYNALIQTKIKYDIFYCRLKGKAVPQHTYGGAGGEEV
jgi:hypothetical protein